MKDSRSGRVSMATSSMIVETGRPASRTLESESRALVREEEGGEPPMMSEQARVDQWRRAADCPSPRSLCVLQIAQPEFRAINFTSSSKAKTTALCIKRRMLATPSSRRSLDSALSRREKKSRILARAFDSRKGGILAPSIWLRISIWVRNSSHSSGPLPLLAPFHLFGLYHCFFISGKRNGQFR